jgi:hypothetical protein
MAGETMTEAEWLQCCDPAVMLESLQGKLSERKLRLFACACCRRVWRWMTDARNRGALEAAERYVDGLASEQELQTAHDAVAGLWRAQGQIALPAAWVTNPDAHQAAAMTARAAGYVEARATKKGLRHWLQRQANLLRDVIGNPFRPVAVDPQWLRWNGCTISKLAQVLHEERAFERLPILGDALEDAGCGDKAILTHCRFADEHVRGCWVVDLILGRT